MVELEVGLDLEVMLEYEVELEVVEELIMDYLEYSKYVFLWSIPMLQLLLLYIVCVIV